MNNKKNKNNKKIFSLISFFLVLIVIVLGVTYAFWTWNSSVNKSVVFSTPDIEKYIIYDEGDSKFIGNFQPVNTFCESAYNTLSFYKKSEAANVKFTATIKMDINSIGKNIASSDDVYWIVTSGNNTIDCSNGLESDGVLAYGTFNGVTDGQTLNLLNDIEVTLEQQTFTVWIWIDSSGENLSKLSGETVDTNVWTLITMDGNGKNIVTFDLNGGEFEIGTILYNDVGEHEFVVPYDGEYKLEVWGAQGGNANGFEGGYGGYSVGDISLKKGSKLFANIGGVGTECYVFSVDTYKVCEGGYNGGGKSTGSRLPNDSVSRYAGSGGGATHIAINSGNLSSLFSSVDDILIVAGGGGGGFNGAGILGIGGSGGGYIGNSSTFTNGSNNVYATGGTQISGGTDGSGYNEVSGGSISSGGGFGSGYIGTNSGASGSGGGGGYYGGGQGVLSSGGGGSGYIGNNLLDNKYMYCYNCDTSDDLHTKTFTTTNVSDVAISNYAKSGNGAARVTLLSILKKIVFGKKYGELPIAYKAGYKFLGWSTVKDDFETLVKDDFIVDVAGDLTLYALFSPIYKVDFDTQGGSFNMLNEITDFTNIGEHEYVVPFDGSYKLEVWGAQGGSYDTNIVGGYGGYSKGEINLLNGQQIYIYVGGEGVGSTSEIVPGGYNGGGDSYVITTSCSNFGGSGGGATHIATKPKLLSEMSSKKEEILIVAGGGGGALYRYCSSTDTVSSLGGSGGGFSGASSVVDNNTWDYIVSTGGNQSSGGVGGSTNGEIGATNGTFGQGGSYTRTGGYSSSGAGGGGYYGGGLGEFIGGGGGSGYIGNSLLTNKAMYCYNCETSSEISTLTYSTTDVSAESISNYAKSGNGAARITFLNKLVFHLGQYDVLPIPSKEFYSFVGWNTKSDGTGEFINSETKVMNDSDHTLYAIWEDNFNVSYSVNGGIINSTTISADGNTTYNWTTNNDIISLNGNSNFYKPNDLSNFDLNNYNDVNYMNISRNGYSVVENSEWICLEGCKVDNSVYSQNEVYKYSDFCDVDSESCNIVLGVNWKQVYTISYDANGGSGAPESQTKIHGVVLTLSSTKPTRDGYKFLGWATSSDATNATYAAGAEFTGNYNTPLFAVWKDKYKETLLNGADPVLEEGMVPIVLSNTGIATVADTYEEWYNYGEKEWANIVLVNENATEGVDGSHSREYYLNNPGATVIEDDILAYYVWIPRYKYQIWTIDATTTTSPQTINIVFEDKDTPKTKGTAVGQYLTHPAFTFGNKELDGMWVGKFETSTTTSSACYTSESITNCNNINQELRILPNVKSLRLQKVSIQFQISLKFAGGTLENGNVTFAGSDIYGLTVNSDSHMMKNSEWGAVAYLSHSQYGINQEIYINNSEGYYTGRSGGNVGVGASTYGTYSWTGQVMNADGSFGVVTDSTLGTKASTTGNVTGVYDMSGGAYEYVMGVLSDLDGNPRSGRSNFNGLNNTTLNTSGIDFPNGKYYDLYLQSQFNGEGSANVQMCTLETCGGGALNETANWYNDNTTIGVPGYPWVVHGSSSTSDIYAGAFSTTYFSGNNIAGYSWRSVVVSGDGA